jgi:hypothetical protein
MAKRRLECKGKEEEGQSMFGKECQCWKNFLAKETSKTSRDCTRELAGIGHKQFVP